METGKFLYKCKACGEIYIDGTTSNYDKMEANFYVILHTGKPLDVQCSGNESAHRCKDGTLAITELVGLKKINN